MRVILHYNQSCAIEKRWICETRTNEVSESALFFSIYSQYLVLLTLWEENPQTLNSIGRHLDLSSNTLTPLLKRLEQSGWVKRERQQSDKRQLIITLTDNGQQQQEAVFEAISSCLPQEFDTTEYDETKYVFEELEQTLKHLIEK